MPNLLKLFQGFNTFCFDITDKLENSDSIVDDCMSDSNLLESGILKKLLGLTEEFFSDLRKTWNPEEVDIKVAIQMKMRQEFSIACSEDNPSIGS